MPSCFFLGTGPGGPVPDRFNSAALLDSVRERLLIDCGEPAAQRLTAHGIGLERIDGVLITHGHADHCGGLPMLIQAMQVGGRRRPLPVWMPRGLIGPFSAWLNACCLFPPLLDFEPRFFAWEDGERRAGGICSSRIGALWVDALRNGHLDAARAKFGGLSTGVAAHGAPCFDSFSLRIRHPDWTAVFSSDIAAADDLAELCDPPPELLVCELSHIPPEELLGLIREARPRRVAVNHVKPGFAERLIELLGEDDPAPILAADGDLIAFP